MTPVYCQREGCSKSWPRDPILEIKCPSCHAEPGRRCTRPSGHGVWGKLGRFCTARDLAADRAGAYGTCPLGRCGIANQAQGALL